MSPQPPVTNPRVDLARAITGPVILITLGVLFAFDRYTDLRFTQTWPILLIVLGLLRLAAGPGRRHRRRDRDYETQSPPGYGGTRP